MDGFKLLESYVKIGVKGFAEANKQIAAIRRNLAAIPDVKIVRIQAAGLDSTLASMRQLRTIAARGVTIDVKTGHAQQQVDALKSKIGELSDIPIAELAGDGGIRDAFVLPDLTKFQAFRNSLASLVTSLTANSGKIATFAPRLAGLALRFGTLATAVGSVALGPFGIAVAGIGVAAFAAFRALTAVVGVLFRVGGALARISLSIVGTTLRAIQAAFSAIASVVGKIGGLIIRSVVGGLTSVLGALTRIVGLTAGLLGAGSAIGLLVAGLKEFNNRQVESKALGSLITDTKEAIGLFRTFTALGERFGDVPGFRRAGRVLLALGSDSTQVREELLRINDIAAATGNRFEDVSRIYTQIRTKNQLYAEEIQQLGDRGIPIINELSRVLGVNQREVRNLAEQGKINFGVFLQAFNSLTNPGGRFFEGAIAQSEALFNQLKRIGQTLQQAAGTALTAFGGVFEGIVNQGRILASVTTQIAGQFAKTRIDAGFLDGLIQNVFLFGARILDTFVNISSAVIRLIPSMDQFRNALSVVGNLGQRVFNAIRSSIVFVVSVVQTVVNRIRVWLDYITQIWNLTSLVRSVVSSVAIGLTKWLASAIGVETALKSVLSAVQAIANSAKVVLEVETEQFKTDFGIIKSQNTALAKAFTRDFTDSIDGVVDQIQSKFKSVTDFTSGGAFSVALGELNFTAKAEDKALLQRSNGIIAENTAAITSLTSQLNAPEGVLSGSAEFNRIQARQLTQQLSDAGATRKAAERSASLQAANNSLTAAQTASNAAGLASVASAVSSISVSETPTASLFN